MSARDEFAVVRHRPSLNELRGDAQVLLAVVGRGEAEQAVVTVAEQAVSAPQLFRQYEPHVLMWAIPSNTVH